jgi:Family of unknown function (DUF6788)
MRRLLDRRRRAARSLPPFEEILRGTVLVRHLRCGKPGCHCASDEGHKVTYLSVTLGDGKTEQISLPKALVPVVKRWVGNYHAWRKAVEKVSAINRDLLREQRAKERSRDRSAQGRSGRRSPNS